VEQVNGALAVALLRIMPKFSTSKKTSIMAGFFTGVVHPPLL
jgi:hypothetical protein